MVIKNRKKDNMFAQDRLKVTKPITEQDQEDHVQSIDKVGSPLLILLQGMEKEDLIKTLQKIDEEIVLNAIFGKTLYKPVQKKTTREGSGRLKKVGIQTFLSDEAMSFYEEAKKETLARSTGDVFEKLMFDFNSKLNEGQIKLEDISSEVEQINLAITERNYTKNTTFRISEDAVDEVVGTSIKVGLKFSKSAIAWLMMSLAKRKLIEIK